MECNALAHKGTLEDAHQEKGRTDRKSVASILLVSTALIFYGVRKRMSSATSTRKDAQQLNDENYFAHVVILVHNVRYIRYQRYAAI